jgi:hypothetical protein
MATKVAQIQELISCNRVYSFWNEAVNQGFCTWALSGLYDSMIAFFVCSALLFFSMICSYSWYTWYVRLDVIGVGWFSDEDVRDTEEYRYQQVQMVNFDFHNRRFGFGVIDHSEQEQDKELEYEHEEE